MVSLKNIFECIDVNLNWEEIFNFIEALGFCFLKALAYFSAWEFLVRCMHQYTDDIHGMKSVHHLYQLSHNRGPNQHYQR